MIILSYLENNIFFVSALIYWTVIPYGNVFGIIVLYIVGETTFNVFSKKI